MANHYLNRLIILFAGLFTGFNAYSLDCGDPQSLTVATSATAHATFSWIAPATLPSNGYDWQLTATGNETVLQQGITQASHIIVLNLTPGTEYTFSVRSNCGDNISTWIVSGFTTLPIMSPFEGQIGFGTGQDLSLYGPICYVGQTIRKGAVFDMLYTEAEIDDMGMPAGAQIIGVAYNKTTNAYGGVDAYPAVRLRIMALNSENVAPLSVETTLGDINGTHTEVMDNENYALPAATGWTNFMFDEPFEYTGSSLEFATVMYHTTTGNQFSTFVGWQFSSGLRDYTVGQWPLPQFDIDGAPQDIILNHNMGGGQFRDRPNIKIFYQVSNAVSGIDVTTEGGVAAEITEDNGILQLISEIAPANASQQVVWEIVSGAEFASVGQDGVVTAFADGIVTVRAFSAEDGTLSDEITITISNQEFCNVEFPDNAEPISLVQFAGIDNATSAVIGGDTPAYEDFSGIVGQVSQGSSYNILVKGNTNGNFVHHVTAYADWNRNNSFEDEGEAYELGTLQNTDGQDDVYLFSSIAVPQDAPLGIVTIRIIKKFNSGAAPCNTLGYGQAEDYTIKVLQETVQDPVEDPVTARNADFTIGQIAIYPNPVISMLTISTQQEVKAVKVFNMLGQPVHETTGKTIDFSSLSKGIYMIHVDLETGASQTFKIIKD